MKSLLLMTSFILLSSAVHAKIVSVENKLYLREKGKQTPLFSVNSMIEKGQISQIKLFGGGDVHLISFAKGKEKEKIYSVDSKGFIYSIEPFTNYKVKNVKKGLVSFEEEPGKKFKIDSNGYFLY